MLIGRYVVGQLIRGALIGVSPLDLSTIAAVSSGLAAIALLACYLPARCVRLDPADSLRQE